MISENFPNSFWPHPYLPNRLDVEARFGDETIDLLRRRGHDVVVWPEFASSACGVCAIRKDPRTGTLSGGADPRHESYALGW